MTDDQWLDEYLLKLNNLIDEFGVAIQGVMATEDDPDVIPFAYTVGRTRKGFPELVIYGLNMQTSQTLLNDLHKREVEFKHKEIVDDLIKDYPAMIIDVTKEHECNMAINIYGDLVTVQQVVFPDAEGRWPWDEGSKVNIFPILGNIE